MSTHTERFTTRSLSSSFYIVTTIRILRNEALNKDLFNIPSKSFNFIFKFINFPFKFII